MPDTMPPFWTFITRFGEAQILLPLTLALALPMWRRGGASRLVIGWLGSIVVVASITTVSKLAFIGWGIGSAQFDFTGVSGHAMFAAAVYPVMFRLLPPGDGQRAALWRALGLCAGAMLAALVGISRLMVEAHSVSEVLAGMALGLTASALTLRFARPSVDRSAPTPRWVPGLVAAWLLVLPHSAPASRTHDLVTKLALGLSGRQVPYQRSDLLRRLDEPPGRRTAPGLRFDAATADPRSPAPHTDTRAGLRGGSRHS